MPAYLYISTSPPAACGRYIASHCRSMESFLRVVFIFVSSYLFLLEIFPGQCLGNEYCLECVLRCLFLRYLESGKTALGQHFSTNANKSLKCTSFSPHLIALSTSPPPPAPPPLQASTLITERRACSGDDRFAERGGESG